jgi:hypothetical protein
MGSRVAAATRALGEKRGLEPFQRDSLGGNAEQVKLN